MKIENKANFHFRIIKSAILGLYLISLLTHGASILSAEQTKKNILKLEGIFFIYIPPGKSIMGSVDGDWDEKPVRVIWVKGFYISRHEVTFAQFDMFCKDTGRKKPSDSGLARGNWEKMGMKVGPGDLKGGRGNLPVINISWYDAKAYCAWLSKKTCKMIRLPYEVEWEYACRAGNTAQPYNNIDDVAWHDGNSKKQTHPVMSKKANGFGLYDMLGNVWEWCEDWYDPQFYAKSDVKNPKGPKTGSTRVVRGGSWINGPWICTAYKRRGCSPGKSGGGLGFRVVLDTSKGVVQ